MKTILSTLLLVGISATCFSQGIVNWSGLNPAAITAQTNSTQYSPVFGGGSSGLGSIGNTAPASSGTVFYYELLYNTAFTGSQVAPPNFAALFGGTWLDTGLTATNSSVPGRLSAVNPSVSAVVPWAHGVTNNIMLVGWSANLGTSWAAVSNELATGSYFFTFSDAYFGESATGFIDPAISFLGPVVFGTAPTASGLPIFNPDMQLYLLPIPEPSTMALAGLSGFLVACRAVAFGADRFRRRK